MPGSHIDVRRWLDAIPSGDEATLLTTSHVAIEVHGATDAELLASDFAPVVIETEQLGST
jgi:hypothetical protein